jgi:hypothetical protein
MKYSDCKSRATVYKNSFPSSVSNPKHKLFEDKN